MFKDDLNGGRGVSAGGRGGKRKRERERHDPQKTLKPSQLASSRVLYSVLTLTPLDQLLRSLDLDEVEGLELQQRNTWFKE